MFVNFENFVKNRNFGHTALTVYGDMLFPTLPQVIWNFGEIEPDYPFEVIAPPDGALNPEVYSLAPSGEYYEPDDLYEITVSESEMDVPSELTTKPFIRLTVDWM